MPSDDIFLNKLNDYCQQIGLLTPDDFQVLISCAELDIITRPSVVLTINIKQIIPIATFKRLWTNVVRLSNSIKVVFKGVIIDITTEQLSQYIQYFLELNHIKNMGLINLVKRQAFDIMESGGLIVHYFNKIELDEFKIHETELVTFLSLIGFNIKNVDYQIDEDRQNFKIYQQKQLDDLKKQTTSFKTDDPFLRKIAIDNEIKARATIDIKDLEVGLKGTVINAQIFDIKPVITTKLNKKIYKFSVTDFTGGIVLTIFETLPTRDSPRWKQQNLPASYLNTFKVGDWIKAQISINTDKYATNELSGIVDKLVKSPIPDKFVRKDQTTKPRIELLARTKMSAFDGISSARDLLKRSRDFNAPAIAIADRCNVQVYPDLFNVSKELQQKPIYGVELDVQDDIIQLVQNATDQKIDNCEYVVFDIETTGLYNEFEELIEFAGVKVHNNMIVDQLQFFIKPEKEIPSKITKLTHITNEMVKNADGIKPSLKRIVEWIGNDVLIAHNGINFDFRFLNKKLEQNNLPLLKNTIVDTMQISRAINTGLKHHNLGIIARSCHINYDEMIAHRADVDVSVLHSVWKNLVENLKRTGIETFSQINTKLQNESLRSHQFGDYQLVYCRTQKGIKDIYRLVSVSCTTDFYNSPRVMAKNLYEHRENLIIVNSPNDGDVWDVAINGTTDELKSVIQKYDYIFVTPSSTFAHEINRGNITKANVNKIIKKIISAATLLNKKVIAVSNTYYLDTWDQIAHSVFVHNKMIGGKQHRLFRYDEDNSVLPDLYYRNTQEMLDEFKFIGDDKLLNDIVIENTYDFNEQIQSDIKPLNNKLAMPRIPNTPEKLKELVESKAKSLYGDNIRSDIKSRIDKELNSIINNGYSIVYWISHLLVKKSLEDGYLVGSRGSVGSSIVAYLANISEVNPLPAHYLCPHCKHIDFNVNHENGFDLPKKECPICGTTMKGDGHNIPFETFLGFHAEKVPDIDLNFSGVYQLKAHQFVKDMFGDTHTIRAGTISTMAQQTARGYVKKYFELTEPDRQVSWTEIDWIANKCIDSKRTTGQHAGGIVIVPKEMDILDFTPYNYPADDKTSGGYTTHFDFHSLHDSLLKFDILGHDDPTALKMLEEITGVRPREIPFMDENVIKLFSSIEPLKISSEDILGETVGAIGLPEFGTGFVRRMLATAQPKSFADLIRIQGLSHGTDVWNNNAEQLISKANKTLKEVIACRDDIMTNLMRKGIKPETAFNAMEDARKGKGVKKYRDELKNNNVDDWYIDSCDKIKYLFPKAHAAAYAVSGWRFAWFKYHFPLAFYATYFSIRPDSFDLPTIMAGAPAIREKLVDIRKRIHLKDNAPDALTTKEKDRVPAYEVALEMYARGFNVKNIDLEKSEASKFIISDKGLIPPFSAIEGMGTIVAESIVNARIMSPFTSKEDLKNRTKVSVGHLDTMNKMNITNKLEEDNQMNLSSFFD